MFDRSMRLVLLQSAVPIGVAMIAAPAFAQLRIGLCGSNFGAMAMVPIGHIAGAASSFQGFITSIGAVIVGSLIGQSYDGTTAPLAIGYL